MSFKLYLYQPNQCKLRQMNINNQQLWKDRGEPVIALRSLFTTNTCKKLLYLFTHQRRKAMKYRVFFSPMQLFCSREKFRRASKFYQYSRKAQYHSIITRKQQKVMINKPSIHNDGQIELHSDCIHCNAWTLQA